MSRIGKLPIKIPTTVDVTNDNSIIKVKGKFGTLERIMPEIIGVAQTDGMLIVSLKKETRANKALHGLYRTLINNMIVGVSEQFLITLILQGGALFFCPLWPQVHTHRHHAASYL